MAFIGVITRCSRASIDLKRKQPEPSLARSANFNGRRTVSSAAEWISHDLQEVSQKARVTNRRRRLF